MKRLPQIYVNGDVGSNTVYLTSGIQAPSNEGSFLDQVKSYSEMQSYASGGSIYHINLSESLSPEKKNNLIKSLFNNFTLRYITLTPFLSICNSCGNKMFGKKFTCTKCESKDVSCWSRPVGYFRPALRGNIKSDLSDSNYVYWIRSRIKELSDRTLFNGESFQELYENLGV